MLALRPRLLRDMGIAHPVFPATPLAGGVFFLPRHASWSLEKTLHLIREQPRREKSARAMSLLLVD